MPVMPSEATTGKTDKNNSHGLQLSWVASEEQIFRREKKPHNINNNNSYCISYTSNKVDAGNQHPYCY